MRIVVVGANSAIAREFMLLLKKRYSHAQFFCVARDAVAFAGYQQQLAGALRGSYCYDFSDYAQSEVVVAQASAALGGIDWLFIAHGALPEQQAAEVDFTLQLQCFSINCLSVMALLSAFEQAMPDGGKIAVISSVAGDRGRPRNYIYGAAKSAVSIYLQGLRSRRYATGLEVYDFKLGPVDSPMTLTHEKNFSFSTPAKVAALMLAALQGKRYQCYVPGYWRVVMWVVRWMPECLFQRLGFLSGR
jgi:short-subunit dehydrogenase